jgi:ABC-type Fe3+ transport system permease subunit
MNSVAMAIGIFSFLWPFGQLFLSALMRNTGSDEPAIQAAEADQIWKTSLGIVHLTVSTALTTVMVVLSIIYWGQKI